MATIRELLTSSITTNTGVVTVPVIGYNGIVLQLVLTGVTNGNFTFEGSVNSTDGTDGNWVQLSGVRSNANTSEATTGNLSATPAYCWDIPTDGCSFFRVRATGGTFGTAVVNTFRSEGMGDNQPFFAPVTGAVTVSGTATVTPTNPTQSLINSAATTNATSVKNSAGNLYGLTASNTNAAARYVKLYNKASAPTVGTDVPVLTIPIPASGVVSLNLGTLGMRFGTGIALAITAGAADSDTAAVAANEIKVVSSYI